MYSVLRCRLAQPDPAPVDSVLVFHAACTVCLNPVSMARSMGGDSGSGPPLRLLDLSLVVLHRALLLARSASHGYSGVQTNSDANRHDVTGRLIVSASIRENLRSPRGRCAHEGRNENPVQMRPARSYFRG